MGVAVEQGEIGLNENWIRPHEEYLRLGHAATERQGAYRALFETAISDIDLKEIRECTHKGWALGNDRFREQIEALGQRRATSKGVGRPRKVPPYDNRV
jgi:putative transposase